MSEKKEIAIVWFKRDLRFTDHEPLFYAQKQAFPILLIYCFEPSVMNYDDSDIRHWRFVYQSLQDMQAKLEDLNTQISIFHSEVLSVFQEIAKHFTIKNIFSHQEIGNKITYDRDLLVHQFCKENEIDWREYQHNGVVRKLKSRNEWDKLWKQTMQASPCFVDEDHWNFLQLDSSLYDAIKGPEISTEIRTPDKLFQQGGETLAWKYLKSFLKDRYSTTKYFTKSMLSLILWRLTYLGPTEKVRNAADARRQGEAVYLILRATGNEADVVFLTNEKKVIFNNQLCARIG